MVGDAEHVAGALFYVFVDEEEEPLAWQSSERHRDYPLVKPLHPFLVDRLADDISDARVLFSLEPFKELILLIASPNCGQRVEDHASKKSAAGPQ